MRRRIISSATKASDSRSFIVAILLPLAIGVVAAQMTLSAALAARAETQAAIDAVTLARPHIPNNSPVIERIEAKVASAE